MSKISKEMTCIQCPVGCTLKVEGTTEDFTITGNKCLRGVEYASEEMKMPKRFVSTTVRIDGWIYPVISVKTAKPIPKDKIFEVMDILSDVVVKAPINVGDVVVPNILDTGVDVIATRRGVTSQNRTRSSHPIEK